MNLLVVRHAIAEDAAEWARGGGDETTRPLTSEGKKKMKKHAAALRRLVPDLDLLATSPFTRAAETAQILSAVYDKKRPVVVPVLAPGHGSAAVTAWLQTQSAHDTVALVGHEPGLSSCVSWLIAGLERSALELKKGGACFLSLPEKIEKGGGILTWLLTPSQLRELED